MKNRLKSLLHALRGLKKAFTSDLNFRLEVWGSLVFILFGYYMFPLLDYEILFLILSYFLILITELVNTAFEEALDKLHPEHDERIGASKDIAAAAVLMSVVFAAVVFVAIYLNHF